MGYSVVRIDEIDGAGVEAFGTDWFEIPRTWKESHTTRESTGQEEAR